MIPKFLDELRAFISEMMYYLSSYYAASERSLAWKIYHHLYL